MIGGKFEMSDLPGQPGAAEVRAMAVEMGRAMYPEKFKDYKETAVISPEEYDQRLREAGLLPEETIPISPQGTVHPLRGVPALKESPMGRLFAAVRAVLQSAAQSNVDELAAAYKALNVD